MGKSTPQHWKICFIQQENIPPTTGKHPSYNRKTPLLQQENIPTTTGKHPSYNRKTSLLQQENTPTTTGKSCHNAKKTCAKGGRADITTIERHAATRRCSARALNRRGPDSRGKATGWALSACAAANPATAASIKKKGRQDAHFHTLSLISTAKAIILRQVHLKAIFLRLA